MIVTEKSWKKLFIYCLGLAGGTAFCMKWMEGDLQAGGRDFSILGLELTYSAERIRVILSELGDKVSTILRYLLVFDFAFMAGVYPGIAALCMIAREKSRSVAMRKTLYVLAALQTLAWAGDIVENYYLLKWIKLPEIGSAFTFYHIAVYTKWIIALSGVLAGIAILLFTRPNKRKAI